MSMIINTNYLSLVAQNNLMKSQSSLNTAITRLSSGLRINSAADDAAGSGIANRMTAQVNGLDQASRNANDGISVVQTAQGALNEINDNLQRVRELTVQAANGTNTSADLSSIQNEINQNMSEINRVSAQTQFNGVTILATSGTMSLQVGANDGQNISINLKKMNASAMGVASSTTSTATLATSSVTINVTEFKTIGNTSGTISVTGSSNTYLATIDAAIKSVDSLRGQLGAVQNRLDSTITNLNNTDTNLSNARSRIQDANYAVEVSAMTQAQILQQAGTSVLAQANSSSQSVLSLLR
ncbi:flagellin [Bordetella sp. FB-8]|uniref:flagellin N-terminal helical domain-containing protein n=1 Tax=Bordetella sp. FB-8 TaxID=1159870 RepID=UPI00036BB33D|nr:flagellin [Bordetella sp. FB-8]